MAEEPKKLSHYYLDFTSVSKELSVRPESFVEFLNKKFRVHNRLGRAAQNLTTNIKDNVLTLDSTTYEFPKNYLRFLVKKFMSSTENNAYKGAFRVIADPKNKSGYLIKAFVYNDKDDE